MVAIIGGVARPLTWVLTILNLFVTLLITDGGPPSTGMQPKASASLPAHEIGPQL